MSIRPAVVAERPQLEALQRRASLGTEGERDALLRHPDAIALPDEQIAAGGVFVLEEDGAIMAFAAVLPREDGDTELDALFVDPESQRRGFGRRLIAHCADMARAGGAKGLHVIGNTPAGEFCAACGFEVLSAFETRFGAGLLMRKPL